MRKKGKQETEKNDSVSHLADRGGPAGVLFVVGGRAPRRRRVVAGTVAALRVFFLLGLLLLPPVVVVVVFVVVVVVLKPLPLEERKVLLGRPVDPPRAVVEAEPVELVVGVCRVGGAACVFVFFLFCEVVGA